MKQRGFSYIEVIMSAVVLSVVMAPVVSGFFLASRNFQYAYDFYRANLEAQNILEQAQMVLSQEKSFLQYKNQRDIFQFTSSSSLSTRDFEYALALYKIPSTGQISEEEVVLESRNGLWDQEIVGVSVENPVLFEHEEGGAYDRYDTVFTFNGRFVVTCLPGDSHRNSETGMDWKQGPYIVFEKTKEPFESYLAMGAVFDKEGQLLKQMIKILTTS